MGIIKSTVKVGQKPSADEIKQIRAELKEAAKYSILYTDDSPESTPEALKEFAMQWAKMNRQKRRLAVTIRIEPDVLDKYKTLGYGCTGIMADVLKVAADNPALLLKTRT
ncbi:MAG: BrnA antitoxin family protein [Treponema sp.]|nr:BrnA antitoxin family protein [Treponema sp.]